MILMYPREIRPKDPHQPLTSPPRESFFRPGELQEAKNRITALEEALYALLTANSVSELTRAILKAKDLLKIPR